MRKHLMCAAVACMAAVIAPGATAAPVILDTPVVDLGERLGKISGYADVLAWSEYHAADATFSLVIQRAGQAPQRLNIAPRNRPFDVDVGPDRDGTPALVYSRCHKEPKQPDPRGSYKYYGLPAYPGGTACDIYKYSLAAGRERRLNDISIRSADEFLPSIWRGKVAFVRQYSSRRPVRLYLDRRDGTGSRRLGNNGDAAVTSVDLRGRRIALQTVYFAEEFCARSDVLAPTDIDFNTSVSIVTRGPKPIRVAVGCINDSRLGYLAGAVWSGSTLIYDAISGRELEIGRVLARASDGTTRTLGTYAFPNALVSYVAVNDQGVFVAVRSRSDGHAHIARLLDRP